MQGCSAGKDSAVLGCNAGLFRAVKCSARQRSEVQGCSEGQCNAGLQCNEVQGGAVQSSAVLCRGAVSPGTGVQQSLGMNRNRSPGGEAQGGVTRIPAGGISEWWDQGSAELRGDALWGQPCHISLDSSAGGGSLEGD